MEINDNQRRKVAKKMREYDVAEFKESAIVPFLECLGHGYKNWRGILDELADLIDRPTATATMDYEAMEDGIHDCRIWTCNGCKESFPAYRGFYPTYCPVCGTELRDGD